VVIASRDRGSANFGRHQPIGVLPVTFDMNDPVFQQIVAQAVAVRLAASKQGSVPKNTIVDGKTEGQLKLDVLVCKTFKKAGFGEVKPRVDVRTFNKWLAEGYRVKPGERATKVRQFRLFHKTQVQYEGQPPKEQAPAEGLHHDPCGLPARVEGR
jgi:hypothetical protein